MDTPNTEFHPEPAGLRRLRRLISTLTVVMIVGVLVIVGLLVTRLNAPNPLPSLPAGISLPAEQTVQGFTMGPGWLAVVTLDSAGQSRIHILSPDGAPRQIIEITP